MLVTPGDPEVEVKRVGRVHALEKVLERGANGVAPLVGRRAVGTALVGEASVGGVGARGEVGVAGDVGVAEGGVRGRVEAGPERIRFERADRPVERLWGCRFRGMANRGSGRGAADEQREREEEPGGHTG